MSKKIAGWAAGLLCCAAAQAQEMVVSKDVPVDVYDVTSEVLVEKPCRFGVNFEGGAPVPWGPFRPGNLWTAMSSMEPYESRYVVTLSAGVKAEGARIMDNDKGGIGYWDSVPYGVYEGGTLTYYSLNGSYMEKVHEAKVVKLNPAPGGEFIEMDPPLPVVPKAGDIIVIDRRFLEYPVEAQSFSLDPARANFRKGFGFADGGFSERNSGAKGCFDDRQKCPEGGSTASLKITLPGGKMAGFSHWAWKQGEFQLRPPNGAEFKGQIWMRQEGMPSGKVKVICGGQYSGEFDVTDEWKKFEWAFTVDHAKIASADKAPDSIRVESAEAGTLWLDNFLLWDSAEPVGAVRKIHKDAMKEALLGTVRIWVPLIRESLEDAIFGNYFSARTLFSMKAGTQAKDTLSVHDMLVLCKETGANPWINLHPLSRDDEMKNLMEYLSGDTSTAWGKRRAGLGQKEPWTKVFDRVYLECGNETWNSIFAPLAWPGRANVYAGVANRMFKLVKTHPLYSKDRLVCIASGWGIQPTEWTKQMMELAHEVDMVDVAAYFGGSDGLSAKGAAGAEGGDTSESLIKAIIRGQLLMSGPGIVGNQRRKLQEVAAAHREKTGLQVMLGDYESGPGYILPGPSKPYRLQSELTGKSLGLGVTTLDSFMMEMAFGYQAVNYFKWDIGPNWVTHNNEEDMIPHVSWIAVTMRNKHCDGSLMKVVPADRKTVDVPPQELDGWTYDGKHRTVQYKGQKDIPLTECYAFKDGKKHAIMVFSRSAEETRKVKLNLPFTPENTAQLHYLTGNYWDGNFQEYKIKEQQKTVTDFSQNYTFDLPPSSIYIFVSEEE
jgi:alpha-L-arabinofuranosidase